VLSKTLKLAFGTHLRTDASDFSGQIGAAQRRDRITSNDQPKVHSFWIRAESKSRALQASSRKSGENFNACMVFSGRPHTSRFLACGGGYNATSRVSEVCYHTSSICVPQSLTDASRRRLRRKVSACGLDVRRSPYGSRVRPRFARRKVSAFGLDSRLRQRALVAPRLWRFRYANHSHVWRTVAQAPPQPKALRRGRRPRPYAERSEALRRSAAEALRRTK